MGACVCTLLHLRDSIDVEGKESNKENDHTRLANWVQEGGSVVVTEPLRGGTQVGALSLKGLRRLLPSLLVVDGQGGRAAGHRDGHGVLETRKRRCMSERERCIDRDR